MSIAALHQVYDEVRRLAIAGSDLAAGDFRLPKALPALDASAKKAPVFQRIADAVRKVVDGSGDSAQALLELSSLVSSVLYTQGQTGKSGELAPLETAGLPLTAPNASARVLKPLLEALTETGSGRLEIIRDAHARGAFADLRLITPALKALDDPYPEIADFVAEHVVPRYGRGVLPVLRAGFDPQGRGPAARRLQLMHVLDPEGTHETVLEALEEGTKEVRLTAMMCLDGRPEAEGLLSEQTKARAKDVRAAAYAALATVDTPTNVPLLEAALGGAALEFVAPHLGRNPNEGLRAKVSEALSSALQALVAAGPGKAREAAARRVRWLVVASEGRTDSLAQASLLECLRRHETLRAAVAEMDWDVADLVSRLARAVLRSDSKEGLQWLLDLGVAAPPDVMSAAFSAACGTWAPDRVYDVFGPMLTDRPQGRSAQAKAARARSDALIEALGGQTGQRTGWWHDPADASQVLDQDLNLDPRWLDAAIAADQLSLVDALARPDHPGLEAYLAERVNARLQASKWAPDWDLGRMLRMLVRLGHPRLVPLFVEAARRSVRVKDGYSGYLINLNVFALIPDLPEAAIAPLEALIPEAEEQRLDDFAEPLDALKRARAEEP